MDLVVKKLAFNLARELLTKTRKWIERSFETYPKLRISKKPKF